MVPPHHPAELALAVQAVCGLRIPEPPLHGAELLLELQCVRLLPQRVLVPGQNHFRRRGPQNNGSTGLTLEDGNKLGSQGSYDGWLTFRMRAAPGKAGLHLHEKPGSWLVWASATGGQWVLGGLLSQGNRWWEGKAHE